MGVLTTLLKLLKPSENDYYNQQTEQSDNWQKIDDYAVYTDTDKNGVWGGEYGGKIQDPIPKELNKRYIDNINGKAFICIKAGDSSVVSNTIEYFTPCNVVDNLDKLQNLSVIEQGANYKKYADGRLVYLGRTSDTYLNFNIPFIDDEFSVQITSVSTGADLSVVVNYKKLSRSRVEFTKRYLRGGSANPTGGDVSIVDAPSQNVSYLVVGKWK